MSDKIGMNHTHIDFHKGTHGYPIKNADDMMKPCPLMPDGIWIEATATCTSATDTEYTWSMSYRNTPSNMNNRVYMKSANAGKTLYMLCENPITENNYFRFLECRMAVYQGNKTPSDIWRAMNIQTSSAWYEYKSTTAIGERYYAFDSISLENKVIDAGTTFTIWAYIQEIDLTDEMGDE